MVKVSVIILNLNGVSYTLNCIKSIKQSTFKDIEIIVFDNGSTDNSVKILKRVKGITLIESKVNLGFSGGNNEAVKYAKGKYIALLNNDLLVDKNWLKTAIGVLETDKLVGIVNPKSYDKYDQKKYVLNDYGTISLMQMPILLSSVKKTTKKRFASLCASGFAIYRKEIISSPFDADYFAYSEDTYLGWLVNLKGYKVINLPSSIVYHEGGKTSGTMKVGKNFFRRLGERNRYLNIALFYHRSTLIKLVPYFLLFSALINIYDYRHFFMRCSVYWWFIINFKRVISKRRKIQKQRRVSDDEILRLMSYKIYEEKSVKDPFTRQLVKVANNLCYLYCRLINIRTYEFYIHKKEEND